MTAPITHLRTAFVDEVPEKLEDGVLYVAPSSQVALHACCCGCGEEVVTPLVRTEYTLTMHGDTASIWPSIGNHDFACASHYIIERGHVRWAAQMSREQIEAGRADDLKLKRRYRPKGLRAILPWLARLWNRLVE